MEVYWRTIKIGSAASICVVSLKYLKGWFVKTPFRVSPCSLRRGLHPPSGVIGIDEQPAKNLWKHQAYADGSIRTVADQSAVNCANSVDFCHFCSVPCSFPTCRQTLWGVWVSRLIRAILPTPDAISFLSPPERILRGDSNQLDLHTNAGIPNNLESSKSKTRTGAELVSRLNMFMVQICTHFISTLSKCWQLVWQQMLLWFPDAVSDRRFTCRKFTSPPPPESRSSALVTIGY